MREADFHQNDRQDAETQGGDRKPFLAGRQQFTASPPATWSRPLVSRIRRDPTLLRKVIKCHQCALGGRC